MNTSLTMAVKTLSVFVNWPRIAVPVGLLGVNDCSRYQLYPAFELFKDVTKVIASSRMGNIWGMEFIADRELTVLWGFIGFWWCFPENIASPSASRTCTNVLILKVYP
jgi:hypothetical protein